MSLNSYADDRAMIWHGDCLVLLAGLPENSVDAIVTDPPYGLGFMGKKWDDLPPGEEWARACLRVLKPGGHLLAFGGTRTWHRLAVAVEDAGFEVRDSIAWMYGSGFPKSLDVSKAIDKAGGGSPEAQSHILRTARERAGMTREDVAKSVGCTVSSVRDWEEGRARATGQPVEFITPSPAYREALADLLGYTADERRVSGARLDRRNDGTVIGLGHSGVEYGAAATPAAREWQGWGTALKPAFEPIVVARKPLAGTVAANVLEHAAGALNIDGCRIDGEPWKAHTATGLGSVKFFSEGDTPEIEKHPHAGGRWPANVVLDESQAAALDEQSGTLTSGNRKAGSHELMGYMGADERPMPEVAGDSGGASRFFYVAKAPKKERPNVDGVAHPTVKPLALMRWLVRLVTPPDGLVLDTFAGSGTTGEACLLEGFRCVLAESEAEYLPLIAARLTRVSADPNDTDTEATA